MAIFQTIHLSTNVGVLNDLRPGVVYKLRDATEISLLAQVCAGGDCAVFLYSDDIPSSIHDPLFRVIINERDLKRKWEEVGTFPLTPSGRGYPPYSEDDNGNKFVVFLNDVDRRFSVSEDEFQKAERLAVWDTYNVIERAKGKKFF